MSSGVIYTPAESVRREQPIGQAGDKTDGCSYIRSSELYLKALQRMKGSAAAELARKVEPFFWADARKVRVWLCAGCAAEAGLGAGK